MEGFWVLVPARGGSQGVPGKNLRMLGSRPLILHVLKTVARVLPTNRIVVSTDDEEISRACTGRGLLHLRPPELATPEATLDEVAESVCHWLVAEHGAGSEDFLLTVQPTSPFLSASTIEECMDRLRGPSRTVLTVTDDRHLRWTLDEDGRPRPLFQKRLNRQQLPPTFVETGGVIGCRIGQVIEKGTRIGEPISLVELPESESLDIDTYRDWAIAEFILRRKKVVIRADGGQTLGLGHIYRVLALAYELSEHHLTIVTRSDGEFKLGRDMLGREPYPIRDMDSEADFLPLLDEIRPDIVILDVLDTQAAFTAAVAERAGFVVTIEDLGPGNRLADLVINDLYADPYPQENHWYGVRYALLGRQFDRRLKGLMHGAESDEVPDVISSIIVTFGGADENNLTVKVLDALAALPFEGVVTVVLGPGYGHTIPELHHWKLRGAVLSDVKDMVSLMGAADLAITSGGRTVTELMVVGVPTLVLCQNHRELRHTHASGPFGVMNLGLGKHVAQSTLTEHIRILAEDSSLRADMRSRARRAVRERSNAEISRQILERAEEKLKQEG